MTAKENTTIKIVTLKDLGEVFIQRVWVILLAAVVVAGGMFLVNRLTFVPSYSSTATLYILRQDNETGSSSTSDFSLALMVVNDCDYLLKSHSVLDEVIRDLNLDIDYEELSGKVSTSNPENTRILEVTVESDSPEKARRIVNALCEIGQEQIAEAMGFQQVNLYEYGTAGDTPCNVTGTATYLLVGIVTAVLVYAAFLAVFLLDDRIHSEEDIERYLGLSILGSIPNANETRNHQYGYYRVGNTAKGQNQTKRRVKRWTSSR